MQYKKAKFTKKTVTVTFDISKAGSNETDDYKKREILSLLLISGAFNPMRKYCSENMPIELDKLRQLKKEFVDLINHININVDNKLFWQFDKIEEL